MSLSAESFRYRCDWRGRNSRPGNHRSALTGSGFEMRENALMRLGEDPRRLDLHRSARDPLQRLWVRRMQHTSTTTVSVLADVSASMAAHGAVDNYSALVQFIEATVRSASINGDRFALHTADHEYRSELSLNARRCSVLPLDVSANLHAHQPIGNSARGLLRAAEHLGTKRSVVFLVSDFYWPLTLIDELCQVLWHLQLVPVMLAAPEPDSSVSSLLSIYRDAESGRQKLQLRLPWREEESPLSLHRRAVIEAFMQHQRQVLLLQEGFDANLVSAYFYS